MASESTEISDIVKKCKILLLDIEGTTTSISFVKDKLFPYAEANVKAFLETQWEDEEAKEAITALRKLAVEDQDKNVEGVVTIPGGDASKEEQIEGLVKSVQWQMSVDRKAGPLKQLQGLIWKQGYDKGDIKGHVYDDVAPALELWRSTEGQKVYIYSSGSVQAQKLLFSRSVAGDLLPHIEGHFDTAIGAKQEAASYAAIVEKIGCEPAEILFLTDIVKEAEAARASGLQAALVAREGNGELPAAAASFPVLHSFAQLAIDRSNKRKPDPQEEEVPAKVPKTDLEGDVKTATEMEVTDATPDTTASETVVTSQTVSASENNTMDIVSKENITVTQSTSKDGEEPEKMEVEEDIVSIETTIVSEQVAKESAKVEEAPVCIQSTIEEITNSKDAEDGSVCDIGPIIEKSNEKTEKNETEVMESDSTGEMVSICTIVEPKQSVIEKIVEQNALVPIDQEATKEKINENSASINQAEPTEEKIVEKSAQTESIENIVDQKCVTITEEKPSGEKIHEEQAPVMKEKPAIEQVDVQGACITEMSSEVIADKTTSASDIQDVISKEDSVASKTTPPSEIIIEDVTNNQDIVSEAEIVDAVPVVEEPPAIEMDDLKNVGDVLEKECDEILSKVKDVTNLAAIPVKSMLNTISEEPMEDENDENTNDIVESILDSEMEVAAKPSESVADNSVAEVLAKPGTVEKQLNEPIVEEPIISENEQPADTNKVTENIKERQNVESEHIEKKIEEKSTTETATKVIQKDEITKVLCTSPEETINGDKHENTVKIEKKTDIDSDSLSGLESNIKVENKETSMEIIQTLPETRPDAKMESEQSTTEIVQNKAENTAITTDTAESSTKPTQTIAEPEESKAEVTESMPVSVDTKPETIETIPSSVQKEAKDLEDIDMETVDSSTKPVENKKEVEGSAADLLVNNEIKDTVDNKMESDDSTQDNKIGKSIAELNTIEPKVVENNTEEKGTVEASGVVTESKEDVSGDVEMETEAREAQVNGKTNGEPEANLNGNASKDEELSTRLSVENGENGKEMNGASGNGDTADVEMGQGDNKVEPEISDIKVKTVATEEPRTDPIEQPVEA